MKTWKMSNPELDQKNKLNLHYISIFALYKLIISFESKR